MLSNSNGPNGRKKHAINEQQAKDNLSIFSCVDEDDEDNTQDAAYLNTSTPMILSQDHIPEDTGQVNVQQVEGKLVNPEEACMEYFRQQQIKNSYAEIDEQYFIEIAQLGNYESYDDLVKTYGFSGKNKIHPLLLAKGFKIAVEYGQTDLVLIMAEHLQQAIYWDSPMAISALPDAIVIAYKHGHFNIVESLLEYPESSGNLHDCWDKFIREVASDENKQIFLKLINFYKHQHDKDWHQPLAWAHGDENIEFIIGLICFIPRAFEQYFAYNPDKAIQAFESIKPFIIRPIIIGDLVQQICENYFNGDILQHLAKFFLPNSFEHETIFFYELFTMQSKPWYRKISKNIETYNIEKLKDSDDDLIWEDEEDEALSPQPMMKSSLILPSYQGNSSSGKRKAFITQDELDSSSSEQVVKRKAFHERLGE